MPIKLVIREKRENMNKDTFDGFDGFGDLDDFDTAPMGKPKEEHKYPCIKCNGTGIYRGVRTRQAKTKCFACNGRGYFKTSLEHRQKSKVKRQQKKAERLGNFYEKHRELLDWLQANRDWNNFAGSLVDQVLSKGLLSDKQLESAQKMREKTEVNRKAREENRPTVDLTHIHEMFNIAMGNGLKRPILRVGQLAISRAPDTGRNAGFLYIKDSGEYAGKLSAEGKYFGVRAAREEITKELQELAKDPMTAASLHDKKTGQCSCCGRELTNAISIELGIGPICRDRWGF